MPPDAPRIYNTHEIAELLHLNRQTVQRMCASREIGNVKLGRRYLITDAQLGAYLDAHRADADADADILPLPPPAPSRRKRA